MMSSNYKNELIKIFLEAVSAVNPARLIAENMKVSGSSLTVCDRTYDIGNNGIYLIGFGKAVLGMASQSERILGDRLIRGIICIPEGIQQTFRNHKEYSLKAESIIEVYEGARNNLPDEKAEKGADAILNLISSLNSKHDKLIALISGGGSALLPKPVLGITLKHKLETIAKLTASGADINEVNTVRKKLSRVKGGALAVMSHPVQLISLILSDVLNDPLDIIASGPTVPDLDRSDAALEVIKKYKLIHEIPKSVLNALQQTTSGKRDFSHVSNFLIGNNMKALKAAKDFAQRSGYSALILSKEVNGFVYRIAEFYKSLLCYFIEYYEDSNIEIFQSKIEKLLMNQNFKCEVDFLTTLIKFMNMQRNTAKNICIIAGGETTVKLKGKGKGGRNQELALIMLSHINKLKLEHENVFDKYNFMFLSAGTDGIDGPTDVAGAVVDYTVMDKATKSNISVDNHLVENDSYNFFAKTDNGSCLIQTGHTGTNVADIHMLSILKND